VFIIYSDELDKNDGELKKLMGDACHALGKIPASGSVNKIAASSCVPMQLQDHSKD